MHRVRPPLTRPPRIATAALLATCVSLTQVGSSLAGSPATVECGQLTAYTAPDPLGPTPGTVGLGLLTAWEIVPTASVSVAAAAALPTIVNSGPTCLAVALDVDGKITSLDFAPEGDITGGVDFDSGSGFYLFADRLIVPNFITDAYPGLAALFVTSYQAGTQLSVTFSVDVTNGSFTGFDGQAEFCGAAGVAGNGDGMVGDARIPAAVLGPEDTAALEDGSGADACAVVHSVGVIVPNSEGEIDVETDVVIAVDAAGGEPLPTLPNTSAVQAARGGAVADVTAMLLILGVALLILAGTRPRAKAR